MNLLLDLNYPNVVEYLFKTFRNTWIASTASLLNCISVTNMSKTLKDGIT